MEVQLPRHAYCTGHLEGQFRVGHEGRVEPCPPCGLCLVPDLIDVLRIPCVGVGGCVLQVGVDVQFDTESGRPVERVLL